MKLSSKCMLALWLLSTFMIYFALPMVFPYGQVMLVFGWVPAFLFWVYIWTIIVWIGYIVYVVREKGEREA